jgi:hypothetical protein
LSYLISWQKDGSIFKHKLHKKPQGDYSLDDFKPIDPPTVHAKNILSSTSNQDANLSEEAQTQKEQTTDMNASQPVVQTDSFNSQDLDPNTNQHDNLISQDFETLASNLGSSQVSEHTLATSQESNTLTTTSTTLPVKAQTLPNLQIEHPPAQSISLPHTSPDLSTISDLIDLEKLKHFLQTKLDPKHIVAHQLIPKQGTLRISNISEIQPIPKLTSKHQSLSIIDATKARNLQRQSANNADFPCFTFKQLKLIKPARFKQLSLS